MLFAELPRAAPLPSERRVRSLFPLLLLVLAALGAGPVGATTDAERLIREQAELLKPSLAVSRAQASDAADLEQLVARIIAPHVDFNRFARLVLGKHWRRLSAEDRARFEHGLARLVIRTYSTALAGASGFDVEYQNAQPGRRPGRVVVPTVIRSAGNPPVRVSYKLYERQGVWRVYDVVIEGISMAANYRSVLAERIRLQGVDAVIDGLADAPAALTAGR